VRRSAIIFLMLSACAASAAPAKKEPVSRMPPEMNVTYGRLFAKDGLKKLSAYPVEIECFESARPEDQRTMIDGQEHSPEMSMTRDETTKGFDDFVAWLERIPRKPGSRVIYARAFDGAKHIGWAALCIKPPAVLGASDFTTEGLPERTVRLTPGALEKLRQVPPDVNIAFMLEDTTLLTTAPAAALLSAKDPTITFKQPGT